jgi:acylphosphatase
MRKEDNKMSRLNLAILVLAVLGIGIASSFATVVSAEEESPKAASTDSSGVKIFTEEKRIEIDAEISKELGRYAEELRGAIEYLAVAEGGKEYESILILKCKPDAVYNSLIKLGLKNGEAARYDEEKKQHILPKGPTVRLSVEWKDKSGKTKRVRAEELVRNVNTKKPMWNVGWVFTGSRKGYFDPESDDEVLMANVTGSVISLHHGDDSTILQNPLAEAAEDNVPYRINDEVMPEPGTEAKLIIDADNPIIQMYILISGQVQGVGFRDFTQRNATKLKINGYAKNLENGKVEVVAEGPRRALDKLVAKLCDGPPKAKVEDVSIEERPSNGKYNDFSIIQ